ncbi:MAG: monomeric [FeFe] hydrogenase [Negativicutes bacterium]|nr:monomeric [FeFe] hydrogenase [Negativicutes bacterium]
MIQVSEVTKIRRKVLAEICGLVFQGKLVEKIKELPGEVVTEDGPRYRCCVHKERAVLKDRINMALSQPIGTDLTVAAERALAGETATLPVVTILPEACDRCPIDKFLVTDACRNCLAHNCITSCPKKAIMVVQNRAYIDKARCVECGLCKRSCSYGAIIEISRPCERACELQAVTAGVDRRAVIDYNKCVACGACKVACPFGAISDAAQIVQLIRGLQGPRPVYALLAPAFVGQFGANVKPPQVIAALSQLGFADVVEAACGADIVAAAETAEFHEAMEEGRSFFTTSCCPAFVGMIEKHMPELVPHVSTTVSPMIAAAKIIKAADPEALVAFVGPCVAKKGEGRQHPDLIDFVLTFEEMAAVLVGAGINAAAMEATSFMSKASSDGATFARAGGVTQAVANALARLAPEVEFKPQPCDGLESCRETLRKLTQNKLDANFIEGMACPGGCVGGPGTLTDPRVSTRLVEQFAAAAKAKDAGEKTGTQAG